MPRMTEAGEDPDTPIWGAENIAQVIGKTATQTRYLLRTKKLPAKQIGKRWVSTRRKLLNALLGEAA